MRPGNIPKTIGKAIKSKNLISLVVKTTLTMSPFMFSQMFHYLFVGGVVGFNEGYFLANLANKPNLREFYRLLESFSEALLITIGISFVKAFLS